MVFANCNTCIVAASIFVHVLPRTLIQTVLRSKPNAIFHIGLVCSSWVAISRASTGRSFLNPLGHVHLPLVHSSNVMVSRCQVQNLKFLTLWQRCKPMATIKSIAEPKGLQRQLYVQCPQTTTPKELSSKYEQDAVPKRSPQFCDI